MILLYKWFHLIVNRTSCRSGSGTIAQRKDEKKSNYIQEDTDKSDKDLCMRSVFSPDDLSRTTYRVVYVCGVSSSIHSFRKINIPHNLMIYIPSIILLLVLKHWINQNLKLFTTDTYIWKEKLDHFNAHQGVTLHINWKKLDCFFLFFSFN